MESLQKFTKAGLEGVSKPLFQQPRRSSIVEKQQALPRSNAQGFELQGRSSTHEPRENARIAGRRPRTCLNSAEIEELSKRDRLFLFGRLRLHVVLTFLLVELTLFLSRGVLVLLVLRHQIVHVALRFRELHLVHALARVPVQERLASEHARELLRNALE